MSALDEIPSVRWVPFKQRGMVGPWLMWKEVEKPLEKIRPGTVVDILDPSGTWVGRGFYNGHARVRVRLLTRDVTEAVDEAFFEKRLEAARVLREEKLKLPLITNAYRLVHSEADHLSGLIVDRYGSLLVLQYLSAGMFHRRKIIQKILAEKLGEVSFYGFAEPHVQKQESFDYYAEAVPEPVLITENGIQFWVSPGRSQKTGYFADQRDNRLRLSQKVRGKRVLDLCCHTGGFSIYAKTLGGAASVDAVDWDSGVIEVAKKNAALQDADVQFHEGDLFQWLEQANSEGRRYDVVVLDPPKQTRSAEGAGSALRRYFAMNRAALEVLEPGGLLVSCSCSGLIREEAFVQTVRNAVLRAGRQVKSLEVTGAALDHPVIASWPNTKYLKVVWAQVG